MDPAIEKLRDDVTELKFKHQALHDSHVSHNATANEKIVSLSTSFSRLHERVDTLDGRIDEVEHKTEREGTILSNKVNTVDTITTTHKQAIQALNDTVSALKEIVLELRRDSKSFSEDIKELKDALKEISTTFKKVMWIGIGAAGLLTLLSNGTIQKSFDVLSPQAKIVEKQ